MSLAGLGFGMLNQLFMNTSNRIGTGASLRRQMLREQERQTRLEAAAGIIGRVEGAKAAGIHPLVAMGSNVGSASVPVGNSFNSAADFSAGLYQRQMQDRELKLRKEENEYNRSLQQKAEADRQAKDALDMEESRARINLIKAQEASEMKKIADSDRDFMAAQQALARQASTRANPLRVPATRATQVKDQYVPVRDRFGKVQYIPNPDIYDLELPSAVGAGTLLLPEAPSLEQRVKKWWHDNVTHPPLPPLPYVPGSSGPSRRYVRKRN